MGKITKLSVTVEASKEDQLAKAMQSIEKQFSAPSKAKKEDPKKDDKLPSIGLLKTMIFDFEQQGKKVLAKMFQKKLDKGEYSKEIKVDVNPMDAKKSALVKKYIDLHSKAKDKDIKKYLELYLKQWKARYLKKIGGKTQVELEDLLKGF